MGDELFFDLETGQEDSEIFLDCEEVKFDGDCFIEDIFEAETDEVEAGLFEVVWEVTVHDDFVGFRHDVTEKSDFLEFF